METAGHARFDIGTTPTDRIRTDSAILTFSNAEWFHLTGVFRPGESVEIYVNGALAKKEPTTVTVQWIENNLPVNIGRRPEPGTAWRGDIDEVRMYARALLPADIQELFAFIPSPRVQAWEPRPANGTVGLTMPLLQWTPGVTAVLHDIYLGTSPDLGPADLVAARQPVPMYYHTAHPEPTVVKTGTWTEWKIPLSEFGAAGVNLARVKTLYLGLGDRDRPAAGGAGLVFLDDIRVIKSTTP